MLGKTSRLRTRYGSRKNRGVKPERFKRGSGKIIRVILQQADWSAGITEIAKYLKELKAKTLEDSLLKRAENFLEEIK